MLEITESGAMRRPAAALTALDELRRLGTRLALDDFGTGYSSLSHLRDFPIDMLKIAKPFIDRLGDTAEDDHLHRRDPAARRGARARRRRRGHRAAEQAEMLRRLECGLGQGFYFSRPLTPADVETHLAGAPVRAVRAVA